jgi:hypothetical protein
MCTWPHPTGWSAAMNKLKKEERRDKWRFDMQRELRFKLLEAAATVSSGIGRTMNVSSGGVLFVSEHQVRLGALIEISIGWPVLLNDDTPVRLVAFGRVVRSEGFATACTIDKYDFRTQANVKNPIPIRNDAGLLRWAEGLREKPFERRASA